MKKIIISCFLVMCYSISYVTLTYNEAKADWFSDFGSGTLNYTSPDYFESQQRGSFGLGGAAIRTPTRNTQLVSIQPFGVRAGCGGIDAQFGGFSFLNVQALVQAFQRILQAAPAFAFKLALQQLCSPCSTLLDSLTSISNALNGLAIDECRVAEKGVKAIWDMMGDKQAGGTLDCGGSGASTSPLSCIIKKSGDSITGGIGEVKSWMNGDVFEKSGCLVNPNSPACKIFNKQGSMLNFAFIYNESSVNNKVSESEKQVFLTKIEDTKDIDGETAPLYYGVESTFAAYIRSLTGDFYLNPGIRKTKDEKAAPQTEGSHSQGYIMPIALKAESNDAGLNMYRALYHGDLNTIKENKVTLIEYLPQSPTPTEKFTITEAKIDSVIDGKKNQVLMFHDNARKALEDITNKMGSVSSGPLNSETVLFINRQYFPLYKLLNMMQLYNMSALNPTSENSNSILTMAAMSNAYWFFNEVSKSVTSVIYVQTAAYGTMSDTLLGVKKEEIMENSAKMTQSIGKWRSNLHQDFTTFQSAWMKEIQSMHNFMAADSYIKTFLKAKNM